MSVGKYSPTVSAAYAKDQKWHDKLQTEETWYDDEGYDSYGYHGKTEKDRAGYTEWDYLGTYDEDNCYWLYDNILTDWTFDGVRPVRIK